ncbi:Xylulose-1,5-bisphosphate phosphatase CbbY, converts this Rubisco inhibiting byproduct to xylulose-5P [hydrothermal vent metagenome]|uniref:Xylulose-1,5-bisphosphate phosphatase CbbY, converts this Rubisco inhibiting byproduct to xylulose-5P n=1 Tax=hydrothermal vent metagenome TaxID=652676 RepID=A0A3B0XER2_9ZZZZ
MHLLEALIFDVDGTLADTERDGHRVAFNRAFKQAGLDWHWSVELYAELLAVTGGKERMAYYLEKFNTRFTRNNNTPQLIRELHASKTAFYTELLSTGTIPLRPGVKRLIEEARAQGLRIAIATTTTPANVSALLEHALATGSDDWFEVIAAGDIVPAKKPAADIYQWALEKLGLGASSCLAFEDSENGIKSSLGAGLKTIITINNYTKTHDFSGAALVLSDMGEPDRAFKTLSGDNFGSGYLDLDLLRKIHAA